MGKVLMLARHRAPYDAHAEWLDHFRPAVRGKHRRNDA